MKSGMCTARCALRILRACQEHNVAWTLENPRASRIFLWEPLHRFIMRHDCICVYIDYCMYGMHYMKPTLFVSNRQEFSRLGKLCMGGHHHDVLAGTVKLNDGKSLWVTSLASAYPVKLAWSYARVAADIAPARAFQTGTDGIPSGHCAIGTASLRRAIGCPATRAFEQAPTCGKTEGRRWPSDAPRWDARRSFAKPRAAPRGPLWQAACRAWPPSSCSGRCRGPQ